MSRGPKYTRNLQKESFEYCVTMVSKNIDIKVVFSIKKGTFERNQRVLLIRDLMYSYKNTSRSIDAGRYHSSLRKETQQLHCRLHGP